MSTVPEGRSECTSCCIVGGGPAGMMLALLLARAGVAVSVLEKHPDFNRDFRGDTIHPATLEIMYQLGLLDELLRLPHQTVSRVGAVLGGEALTLAEFNYLPVHAPFIALMPQWDLLNFLATEVRRYPNARVLMQHKVTRLLEDAGVVTGVQAETPYGAVELRATLTVGCDGRHSTATESAGLAHKETGVPIDVLWFKVSRRTGDPEEGLGFINFGRMLVLINRGDIFQCGYIIRKDSFATVIQPAGLAQLRQDLGELVPVLREPGPDGRSRLDELTDWGQLKLLTVQVNHLRRWHRPGLLCIGDAAHAMSPVGGIGINLAIQDAVAAANILIEPLQRSLQTGVVPERVLARVQRRRAVPTRLTQGMQVLVHRFLNGFLGKPQPIRAPLFARLANRYLWLRRLAARFIGMGLRPERVRALPRPPASPERVQLLPKAT